MNLNQVSIEQFRYRILKASEAGRPEAVSEELILGVLEKCGQVFSALDLRKEADYLEDLKLIKIHNRDSSPWLIEILPMGVDVLQGNAPCPAGISIPRLTAGG